MLILEALKCACSLKTSSATEIPLSGHKIQSNWKSMLTHQLETALKVSIEHPNSHDINNPTASLNTFSANTSAPVLAELCKLWEEELRSIFLDSKVIIFNSDGVPVCKIVSGSNTAYYHSVDVDTFKKSLASLRANASNQPSTRWYQPSSWF